MKFKANTRRRALEYEKDWVEKWKADKTFEKSVENRPKDNAYVFYDGPPFISGVPHHGTLLSSIVKDAVPRYQTMKGKRVERVWGWDAHGLPAERFTEKKLGISSRQEVLEYGLEKYINATRENMLQTSSEWEDVVDRVGRWVDFKGAYKTMDKDYMESIWWAFKTLYDRKKIYEGEKVLMYCTLDGTPLSKAEVTMDAGAYQEITEPSVYVKFKLKENNENKLLKKDAKVLFVCNANVGRSQFAQGFYNNFTSSKNSTSAGVHPDKGWEVHKNISDRANALAKKFEEFISPIDIMDEVGIDISDQSRMLLTKEKLRDYDLIVNLAERQQTPEWLKGENIVWWDVPDPTAEGSGKQLRAAREEIANRVQKLADGEIEDDNDEKYLLAWTTTPWTLQANTAVAVNKDVDYVEVEVGGEKLILAKDLVEKALTDEKHNVLPHKILREFKGSELVGKSYEPLFVDRGGAGSKKDNNAHKIWHADYVETDAGTGIVHLAPTYGEEDFQLAKEKKFPAVHVIDQNGFYTEGEWKGENVWEINKTIAKTLHERGVVWKIDYIKHSYPHCHRCGTKLMYRAHPSWFMNIDGQREKMLEKNESINWFPAHLKHGRFEKTVLQAPDWNISRDRFWATAMPVWKSESGNVKVVGSYDELEKLSGKRLDDYHRPYIDNVTFEIDGETYTRIDKVMDSWFEAGSMPFAQFHYPFENKEKFEENFPGDFIVEYIGQVRAWFYYMHAMNIALFGENSFKNVITTGNVAGNDGRKMSKSYGNFTDPNELMDKFSADSLRFLLLSSPLLNGEDFALQDKEVGDVARKLSMIWNMYDFFTMYAEVDGWEFDGELKDPLDECDNPLDIWIISRLHELVAEVEKNMDAYDIPDALAPILPFLDDASNWYVRRSRRRFWKSGDDHDKQMAYKTLHYVLVRLAYVLAPFTPFLAEELYSKLTGDAESIHLKDWLPAGRVNQIALRDMKVAREAINQGLAQRAKNGIKVRQPLSEVKIYNSHRDIDPVAEQAEFEEILKEELNVHNVTYVKQLLSDSEQLIELNFEITPELKREGLMREVVRHVQSARKKAGLNIDDHIKLSLATEDETSELLAAINEHEDAIMDETLADHMVKAELEFSQEVSVEGETLIISLEKI